MEQPIRGEMGDRVIAVLGGCGFLGRHLAPWLAECGWTVRVVARNPPPSLSSAAGRRIIPTLADLCDEE